MEQQEKMFALVDEYQRSDQSQKDFCLEAGVKPSTFSYWIKKRRMSSEPHNAFLRLETKASVLEEEVEILYPNGVRLKTNQRDLSVIGALIRLY
jgi:hypothetical protein